jgi:hypothetical protein
MNINQGISQDYDPLAQFRQVGSEQKKEEDPLDEFRKVGSSKDIEQEDEESSFGQNVKDAGKQFLKNTISSLVGGLGEAAQLANSAGREKLEEDVKQKFKEDQNYEPSIAETYGLGDDFIAANFPNKENVKHAIEFLGGPGEPKNKGGRYGKRIGDLYGSGGNILPAIVGGVAGQTAEEAGGDPLTVAAAEIVAMLATPSKGVIKGGLEAAKANAQKEIDTLRKLGYADKEIGLALNRASKGKKWNIRGFKSENTEKAFENFAEKSDRLVNDILVQEIPGIGKGIDYVHEVASDAYGILADKAKNIPIKNSKPFKDSINNVVDQLKNNLGVSDETNAFIKRLNKAKIAADKNPTAENYMNFYKELGKAGKWIDRSQKDRLLTQVRNGIKDSFKGSGKEGVEFAEEFEKVNKGIQKAYKAEEINDLLAKVTGQEGINYKGMSKIFDKKDNIKLFEEVLGTDQTRNLQQIAKVGKEVKDFDKAWKATSLLGTKVSNALTVGYYLFKNAYSPETFMTVVGAKIGEAAARKLVEKSLTDPKFQNLMIRGMHALKVQSPKAMGAVINQMNDYLEKEDEDIDLNQAID